MCPSRYFLATDAAQAVGWHVHSAGLLWHLIPTSASVEAARRPPPAGQLVAWLPPPRPSHPPRLCQRTRRLYIFRRPSHRLVGDHDAATGVGGLWTLRVLPPPPAAAALRARAHARGAAATTTTRMWPSRACPLAASGSVPPSRGSPPLPPSPSLPPPVGGPCRARACGGVGQRGGRRPRPAVGLRRRATHPGPSAAAPIIFLSPARRGTQHTAPRRPALGSAATVAHDRPATTTRWRLAAATPHVTAAVGVV